MKWRLIFGGLAFFAAAGVGAGAWFLSDLPGVLRPALEPLAGMSSLSAERCGVCHFEIKREWAQSHHAQAISDPLYQADLLAQGSPRVCNHCHAPLIEQQPELTIAGLFGRANPRYDAQLQQEGVTCVACHQRDGAIDGPRGGPASHPTRKSSALSDGSLCAPCHTLALTRIGDFQRPLMATVEEWGEYKTLGGDKFCVDCHMPRVGARRSHRLLGPFDLELVQSAIEVRSWALSFDDQGARGSLVLFNATGHRLPTAEPHRSVWITLELSDAAGTIAQQRIELARHLDLEALKEAPGQDSSLLPREERKIELALHTDRPPTQARLQITLSLWEPSRSDLTRTIYEQVRARQ